MAEFSDPDFLILTDVGRFPCIIFKTSNIERSSHSVHSEVFSALHGNKIIEITSGADPGEVKRVNFHPPFSEPPCFFFFLSLKY